MFSDRKSMVVVYKDEVLLNFVRKLVETNDDSEDRIVGTKDGSTDIVAWTEKVFADNKKTGKTQNKIMFLGKLKCVKDLIPVIDIRFEKYGVKYGWAGRQAVVYADTSVLKDKAKYDSFLSELKELPVPQSIKNRKAGVTPASVISEVSDTSTPQDSAITAATIALTRIPLTVGLGIGTAILADAFKNKKLLEQQMLLYGIINFYNNDLRDFLES